MGSAIAEKKGWFAQLAPGRGCAHVLVCTCVFAACVCSPSWLYTDMHLLPCLEQRQLPLPFTDSQHKPDMKYLPQCKSI